MPHTSPTLHPELGILGCNTAALVEVSKQFAEFEFEAFRRNELTAAQVAANKADWAEIGASMGIIYQALCDGENEKVMGALHTIETVLMRHGVLVPQPTFTPPEQPTVQDSTPDSTPATDSEIELPAQEELNYGK